MQRVAALSGLIMCACLVAGCGGSALQAKARKVVGDPQATVVSTQTVDPLGGGRVVIVVVRPGGSQGLGCAIAASYLLVGSSDSLASGCPRWSDAYVLMNPTTHAAGIDLGISKWQVAAIARARATSPRFQMFPSVNQLAVRCPIPHASPSGGTLSGACLTTALPWGSPVHCVAFSEAWRPSAESKLSTRGWIVTFSQSGQVQSTRAATHPPQRDGPQPNTCSAI